MIIHPGSDRYLAHKIFHRGREYSMSVVEIAPGGIIRITPFTGETHSTVFVSGSLYVLDSSAAPWASLLTAPPDSGEVTARGLWHSAGTPLFLHF